MPGWKFGKRKMDKGNPSHCHIPIITHDVTQQADLGYILHHSTGHKYVGHDRQQWEMRESITRHLHTGSAS